MFAQGIGTNIPQLVPILKQSCETQRCQREQAESRVQFEEQARGKRPKCDQDLKHVN